MIDSKEMKTEAGQFQLSDFSVLLKHIFNASNEDHKAGRH